MQQLEVMTVSLLLSALCCAVPQQPNNQTLFGEGLGVHIASVLRLGSPDVCGHFWNVCPPRFLLPFAFA